VTPSSAARRLSLPRRVCASREREEMLLHDARQTKPIVVGPLMTRIPVAASNLETRIRDRLRWRPLYLRLTSVNIRPERNECGWAADVTGDLSVEDTQEFIATVTELQRLFSLSAD
jgi:hypothetical protein